MDFDPHFLVVICTLFSSEDVIFLKIFASDLVPFDVFMCCNASC